MTRFKIATMAALGALGLSAPALADHDFDDHDQYHQELGGEHAAEHQELDAEHQQFHAWDDAAYAQQLQSCGWDARCRWLVERRFDRRHRLEHLREAYEHQDQHEQLANEHEVYHQVAPGYGGGYDPRYGGYGSYQAPRRWSPRVWLRFGR